MIKFTLKDIIVLYTSIVQYAILCLFQNKKLQKALLPIYNRQIIAIDIFGNSTIKKVDVHKHNHPIMKLHENTEGLVKQSVVCRDHKEININRYLDFWTLPRTVKSFDIERLVQQKLVSTALKFELLLKPLTQICFLIQYMQWWKASTAWYNI